MNMVISAGDPSGDARAAELLGELAKMTKISAMGLGGRHLRRVGFEAIHDLENYSVMGFTEVLTALPRILKLRSAMKSLILEIRPDVVLLVDYPGFNLPLATWAKARGFRVVYYVSPQIWAWGRKRLKKIKDSVDLMITLFDFEADFYRRHGVRAVCTGHPLVDAIPQPMDSRPLTGRIALLPGSRRQEITMLVEPMAGALRILKAEGVISEASVSMIPGIPEKLYAPVSDIPWVESAPTVEAALRGSSAAVVCSGTATLETALWGVPFLVAYVTSPMTWLIARMLVRGVDNIGMANLVAGFEYAPELLQRRVTPENMAALLGKIVKPGPERDAIIEGNSLVRKTLGAPGSSRRAAELLLEEAGSAET